MLRALGVLYIGLILGGLGIHFWTVKVVNHTEGLRSAIVALIFPVGAEVYWAIKQWRAVGIANIYTLTVFGYGLLWLLMAWELTLLERRDQSFPP